MVRLLTAAQGPAAIVGIEPRTTVFTRAGYHGRILPVVANVELLVVVISTSAPPLSLAVLDRFLVLGEMGRVRCAVCLNKTDLADPGPPELAELGTYAVIGYPVVRTSALTGEGLDDLHGLLKGRISAFVGPSGTGKSSLVNAIVGSHAQEVRSVSAKIGRGRHTTTQSRLLPLGEGSFLADTPGLGWLGMPPTDLRDLAVLFPELRSLQGRCRFSDCSHLSEPGCAVKAAVDAGVIASHRYASFVTLSGESGPAARETRSAKHEIRNRAES
jgi:ribosome biogenesis GTPase